MKTRMYLLVGVALTVMAFPSTIQASAFKEIGSSFAGMAVERNGTDSTFIYDDGTSENGWYINPDLVSWLGNFFPVSQTTGGVLTSAEVFFLKNLNGENLKVSVDIFNSNFEKTGSSALFTAVAGSWIPVDLNDVPFLGPFYAMVKWNSLSGASHFLAMDNNGPLASQDLERYYDGTTFQKLAELGVSDPGVFLLRIHATIDPAAAIEDLFQEELSVYPNPAGDYLNISSMEGLETVTITDLSGKVLIDLQAGDSREMRLDISGLQNGFYCVVLATKERNCTRKISVFH